jgi:hypothetical protein
LGGFTTRDGVLIFGDFDNNYINIYNKLAINTAKTPAYNLEVNGDGYFSDDLWVNDTLRSIGELNVLTSGNGALKINTGSGSVTITGGLAVSGDISYVDTYWDDMTTSAAQAKINPATSKPAYNTDSLTLVFDATDSVTNFLVFNFQLPHRYKAGTNISPHLHYVQRAAADTCEWFIILYKWTDLGEAQTTAWTRIHSDNQTYYAYIAGSAMHQLVDFPDISGAGHTESSILDIKLLCWADAAISLKQFDIHFETDKPGSDNEIP